MQSNGSDFYYIILQWLKDPTVMSALGGVILAVGAFINKTIMAFFKSIWCWLKNLFKEKKVKVEIMGHQLDPEYLATGMHIQRILDHLLIKLDCARISIVQFQNGHTFSLSNPVFKMSTTFEACSAGFASTDHRIKESMVAPYINVIAPSILVNNPVSVPGVYEVDKCTKDDKFNSCTKSLLPLRILKINRDELAFCAFRTLLDITGVEAAYTVLLSAPDNNNGPIGILLIQFHEIEGSKEKIQEATCDICAVKHTLQNLLYSKS